MINPSVHVPLLNVECTTVDSLFTLCNLYVACQFFSSTIIESLGYLPDILGDFIEKQSYLYKLSPLENKAHVKLLAKLGIF